VKGFLVRCPWSLVSDWWLLGLGFWGQQPGFLGAAGLLRVMVCVAEVSAHQFKGSKERAEAGQMRALRYETHSSASRLRSGTRCVQIFKGSKECKECARICVSGVDAAKCGALCEG